MGLEISVGLRIGKYRVVAPIAVGGMGGIWAAEDDAGRPVALKAPLDDVGAIELKRFAREVNALALIDHPNLIRSIDALVEAGTLILVMERAQGMTLREALDPGAMAPRRALAITQQILAGLGYAHGRGLVHRDLKPDNIMLVADIAAPNRELVKILDFGMVKLLGDSSDLIGGGKLTRTGTVFGTPAYMAPEQALGRLVDGRADLYALGVILFELLVGGRPFHADDPMELLKKQVKQPAPRLDEAAAGAAFCTPQMIALVDGALAKDPTARFGDAAAMAAALAVADASIAHLGSI